MAEIKKTTPINEVLKLAPPCKCQACNHGCELGSGCLVNEDLPKIAEFLGISEDELKQNYLDEVERFNTKLFKPKLKKYPYGRCIFYENGCKIHKAKPLECKISMPCKSYGESLSVWFMLNHFINKDDPESIRQFNTYLKSDGKTLDGGKISDFIPNKEILKKILSYEVIK